MMSKHPFSRRRAIKSARGFTMIELIVVMAVIALLVSLAMPRYIDSIDRGKEQVLKHDIAQLREAIDHYYGDRGVYPDSLDDLVTKRYLRAVPVNPFTELPDWVIIAPSGNVKGQVFDVQSPGREALSGPGADTPAADAPASQP